MEKHGPKIPKCPLCKEPYVNGALTYSGPALPEPQNICMPCVFKALDFYIGERAKRLKV